MLLFVSSEAVSSKLVILESSRTVILPPMVSILCLYSYTKKTPSPILARTHLHSNISSLESQCLLLSLSLVTILLTQTCTHFFLSQCLQIWISAFSKHLDLLSPPHSSISVVEFLFESLPPRRGNFKLKLKSFFRPIETNHFWGGCFKELSLPIRHYYKWKLQWSSLSSIPSLRKRFFVKKWVEKG